MVKAVVGEETQLKLVEDRLSQSHLTAQVGLVIGKLCPSLDKGFVFDLIPTPPNDGGDHACYLPENNSKDDKKKGSKGKAQSQSESPTLVIDSEWVAEHARQVSRMLLGGMDVVGIYVWAPESSFKNSSVKLWQTVKEVAQAASTYGSDLDELLLIHISYSPRRWICRNCSLGSTMTSTSFRPSDFKMGRVLASLQAFRCIYNFDIRLPIYRDNGSKVNTLINVLQDGISRHAKELKSAKAIIDGNLVVEDHPCASDGAIHEVQLLLPFMKDAPFEACSQKEVLGLVVFRGSTCSYSYLSPKVPVSQAVADLKRDVIKSLKSRLEIISDEAEEGMDSAVDGVTDDEILSGKSVSQVELHLLRKQCSLPFPRRVFVPWLADTFICDYLQPSETLQVLRDHCKELMSMEAPTDSSTIMETETEPTTYLTIKSFRDAAISSYSTSRSVTHSTKHGEKDSVGKDIGREPTKSITFSILIPIIVLILAVLVGLGFFVSSPKA